MSLIDAEVRIYFGTPPLEYFATKDTTPFVIDVTNALGYFVDPITGLVTVLTAPAAPAYLAPAFSSFGISGVANLVEVGFSFGPSATFTWGTTNSGNVAANTIAISDLTLGTSIVTGQANSGSYAATLAGAVTRTTAGLHSFRIQGTNSNAANFTRDLNEEWRWRLYYGVSANVVLTGPQILALASSALPSGYAGSYATGAGGYKYLCLSDSAGGQITTVKDLTTGFNVPMATVTDNAAYSNIDGGGFSYALVSVTNAFSVVSNVRVYRSKNNLGGAVTLVVT